MRDERKDVVREHEFDGIREFDNRLPNWWLATFVLSVLFGLWYWTSLHTFAADPNHQREEFRQEYEAARARQAAHAAGELSDEDVLAAYHDPGQVKAGGEIFSNKCAVCHRADAGGLVGPNLADDHWIHGSRPSQIAATISNGVPEKGMLTWKGVLSSEEIRQVSAYVVSVHGSHPKDPKEAQGKLEAWSVK